jgi:hypothetical protein
MYYRCDPIPHTGIHRCNMKKIFKYPKTTQERKIACGHITEKIYVRPTRNHKNIPNAWNDRHRTDIVNNSWKLKKKKKQWM